MRHRALLAILTANVLGGLTYPWQKMALTGMPPATVTLGRNVVALLCMLLWMLRRGGIQWRYGRRDVVRLLVLGIGAYAMPLLLGIWGVERSTAGNGSILILLEPASILVLSWLLLGETLRRLQLLGFAAGLGGALLIVLRDAPVGELLAQDHLTGNILLATHGLLWGLYSPVMKPLAERYRAVDVTFAAMVLALLVMLPAAAWEWHAWTPGPQLPWALWKTLELGLAGSFAATVLWTWSLRHLKASTIAPFVFIQPLAGVLAGHLLLGEAISSAALMGGALIAVSVLLVMLPAKPAIDSA